MVVCGRAEMRENIPLNLVHWVIINSNNHTFMFQTMVPYHMTNKHPYICNCLIFNLQILNQTCPVSDQDDLYDWRLIKVQDMGNSHLEMENAFSINTLTFPYCPTPAKCLSDTDCFCRKMKEWKNDSKIKASLIFKPGSNRYFKVHKACRFGEIYVIYFTFGIELTN